ncbi:MAG: hypothetical protein E7561_01920 [Ruminococcaceae bacterium]|nr:hypothetical protein [Oscillospiraceae bacterium]
MKFPHLNRSFKSFERDIKLDGGLNTSTAPMVLSENTLSECNNMIFENSLLKTRKGFYSDEGMIIKNLADNGEYTVKPLEFSSEQFVLNGDMGRIGHFISGDGMTYQKINVFFFYNDNSHISLGEIFFNRIDENTIFLPHKFIFFKGAATYGSGIYLFCEAVNYTATATEKTYLMYELKSDFTDWIRLGETDCYIPTLYYNGRGNLFFESAEADNDAYKKPLELESQNMLTGWFKTYFSADGKSDTFQLPVTSLDNKAVVCTLNLKDGVSYQWFVREGESEREIDFLTTKVKVKVNRENGIIKFLQDENPYPLPIVLRGNTNNLCIMACKKVPYGFESIVSSDNAVTYKSNIVLSGNSINENEVYVASIKNPLYFSKDSKTYIGSPYEKITALSILGDSLVAFKANEVYSIKITNGSLLASTELISGIQKSFYAPQTISSTLINSKVGCAFPKTVCALGPYLLWKSKFKIYAMSESGKHYTVSYPISAEMEENTNNLNVPFAFLYENFYCVVINGKIYLADINNATLKNEKLNARWYMWSLPSGAECSYAIDFEGKTLFALKDIRGKLCYKAILDGAKDIVFEISNDEISKLEYEVGGYFKTAFFDTDAIKIETVTLSAGALDCLGIEVDTHYKALSFKKNVSLTFEEALKGILKKITVYPSLKADKMSIKISGDNMFYIDKLNFTYR